ncbi:MAG: S41 family peptidase, partial [Saprospiraceae bacterium]
MGFDQLPNPPKSNIWLPLFLSIAVVLGILIGYNLQPQAFISLAAGDGDNVRIVERKSFGKSKLDEVLRYIDGKYVEEVDSEKIMEDAIDLILDELDPHSNYIPKDELVGVNESLDGQFVGVGIEFDIIEDTIVVLQVVEEGPSDEAGMKPGDRIVSVGDSTVAGIGIETGDVGKLLKGKLGTKVSVNVKRFAENKSIPLEIRRGKIPINSIEPAIKINDKTGYIKIKRFSSTTYGEFIEEMDKLELMGIEDLVIDVRGNPGGYLQEATRILNQLIPKRDALLVYTEGKSSKKKTYKTKGGLKYELDDIAILIDESSASASEILAGVLQDWDRAIVVGRRSYGKGLVQEQYDLSDGAALRLTIAKYYIKSGRLIQKSYKDK